MLRIKGRDHNLSIRKIIIKILIYVCIVILIYFHKTPHYRTLINLNSENVENVDIYIRIL